MSQNARRVTIGVLILLTLILAGISVFVAFQLSDSGDDTSVSSCQPFTCPEAQCPDGTVIPGDNCPVHASCDARLAEACVNNQGGGNNSGGNANRCPGTSPTSSACLNQPIGSTHAIPGGSCTCTINVAPDCACVPNQLLPEGASCDRDSLCASGNCVNNKCTLGGSSGDSNLGVCGGDGDCDQHQYCDPNGACTNKLSLNQQCSRDRMCSSNTCIGGVCTDAEGGGGELTSGNTDSTAPANNSECTITQPGGLTGCIVVDGPASCQFELGAFTRPMTGPEDECFTSDNGTFTMVGPGTYCPDAPPCTCRQVDITENTPAATPGPFGVHGGNWNESCVPEEITTYTCNDNFQCVAISGSGGEYSTQSACDANCVEGVPQCGDTCTDNTQCPTNHSCTNGTCTLNGCTDTTCTNGCSPICGGPCSPGDPNSCPQNHTCDPSSNTCVVSQCLNNPECTNNGCTLPVTAFGDSTTDYLLTGMLLTLMGIFTYRYQLVQKSGLLLSQGFSTAATLAPKPKTKEEKEKKKTEKEREKFEKKFRN